MSTGTPERGQTEVGQKWFAATPHSGTSWAVTRGRGTAGGIRRRPVYLRNNQPDVPEIGPAPTGRRDTAGEASTDRFTFSILTPVYPSLDRQLPGLGAQPGFTTGLRIACPT